MSSLIDRSKVLECRLHEWFYGKLGDQVKKELTEFNKKTDLFDSEELTRVCANGGGDKMWWSLFNLALWWKEYINV